MARLRKLGNKDYYISRETKKGERHRMWYLGQKCLPIKNIQIPKELWGKKLIFKVIIFE